MLVLVVLTQPYFADFLEILVFVVSDVEFDVTPGVAGASLVVVQEHTRSFLQEVAVKATTDNYKNIFFILMDF